MEILYLSTDQLIAMHETVLTETGGLAGVRSYHQLASVVGQVQQSLFGEDAYATLADKAAAYAFFLTMNHPFNDGNKRTAVVALDVFLDQHGHLLEDSGELELDARVNGLLLPCRQGEGDTPRESAITAAFIVG